MVRSRYKLNRWNWSERAEKWVFIESIKGSKKYTYSIDPPKEFVVLSNEITKINEIMLNCEDPNESERLFLELIKISKKMQDMGKGEY